jgi:dihydrofolate reductase
MRKLKLQMQISVDGYVARPDGQLDWMTWDQDEALLSFIEHLAQTSDTILMGRKMSHEFITHWEHMLDNQPDHYHYRFAPIMVNLNKIVFSKTIASIPGRNVSVENGDLVEKVTQLKSQGGKDIIAYGGASLVSSLIRHNLIDDYYLFLNPTAIGDGLSIFSGTTPFRLVDSRAYECGVVVNHLQPRAVK